MAAEGEDGGLEEIASGAKLRDLGLEWSDRLVKEFMDQSGKDYKGEERALFYMTLGGDLLAKMYVDVRKDVAARYGKEVGEQVAQKLLRTAFGLSSMLLRRHGEEVAVQIQVDFTEVANFRNQPQPEEPRVTDTCSCALDQDGHCTECASTFKKMFSGMAKAIEILQSNEAMKQNFCRPCAPRHMDAALAQVVREDVSKLPSEGAGALMDALFTASQGLRAMPMPLTKKAWSELQA